MLVNQGGLIFLFTSYFISISIFGSSDGIGATCLLKKTEDPGSIQAWTKTFQSSQQFSTQFSATLILEVGLFFSHLSPLLLFYLSFPVQFASLTLILLLPFSSLLKSYPT